MVVSAISLTEKYHLVMNVKIYIGSIRDDLYAMSSEAIYAQQNREMLVYIIERKLSLANSEFNNRYLIVGFHTVRYHN